MFRLENVQSNVNLRKKIGKIDITTQSSEPGAKMKLENHREFQVNLQKMPNDLVFILRQDLN